MGDLPIVRLFTDIYESSARPSLLLDHTTGESCLFLAEKDVLTIRWF